MSCENTLVKGVARTAFTSALECSVWTVSVELSSSHL